MDTDYWEVPGSARVILADNPIVYHDVSHIANPAWVSDATGNPYHPSFQPTPLWIELCLSVLNISGDAAYPALAVLI